MLTRIVKQILTRCRDQRGTIMISFAVLLPILMILVALGINSVKMFIAKAKLSDVSAEVGLIVSASSSVTDKGQYPPEMKNLVTHYVQNFFPEASKTPEVTFKFSEVSTETTTNAEYMTYHPSIKVELPFPFYHATLSEGAKNFTISATPLTVKKQVSRPVDVLFIVDFSTSQKGTKMRILKEVFRDLTNFILSSNPESKVGIVPFSSGVAVKYPETNQRGGPKAGCSVLFVPKKEWAIDYAFWGDKYVNKKYTKLSDQSYYIDDYRRKYYLDRVAKSRPALTADALNGQWCRKNDVWGTNVGQTQYSCFDHRFKTLDLDGSVVAKDDIYTQRAQQIIEQQYAMAFKVRERQRTTKTIEHDDAIDYEATLNQMFSEEAIITFPMLWTDRENYSYRVYNLMCHNTGWWGQFGDLSSARLYSWLIELTNNANELHQFQNMEPQGWTATSSGLVRSVPVMMKGTNPRKIFVVMSDGDDSTYPAKVTDRYLKQYNLCEKIRSGIIERSQTHTERVDIYYVSTTNSDKRVNYWKDYCTGEGNAAKAVNRQAIVTLIKGFLSDEIGSFSQ